MRQLTYLDETGVFTLRNAQRYAEVYFPLVNEAMMSSVTPLLAGDCKSGQNTFLLAPASEDSLRSGRDSRNFWVRVKGGQPWSVTGQSVPQQGQRFDPDCEEAVLTGGLLWQRVTRENRALGLRACVLSFVPAGQEKIEIMQVILTNIADRPLPDDGVVRAAFLGNVQVTYRAPGCKALVPGRTVPVRWTLTRRGGPR